MPFLLLTIVSNHAPSQTRVFDIFDFEYLPGEPGQILGAGDAEVNETDKISAFVRAWRERRSK